MNRQKMVKRESDFRSMTKNELKQWLTKHEQRLPAHDEKKAYYFEKAVNHFRHLKQKQSRSRTQQKEQIVSDSRTKKKYTNKRSKTPTSSSRSRVVRRQSANIDSSSSSSTKSPPPPAAPTTRSKRKVHKIPRKTPTKRSPALSKSIKMKRERVRRATADTPKLHDLNKSDDDDQPGDDDERDQSHSPQPEVELNDIIRPSENSGDFVNQRTDNLLKRKFVCDQDPEKMTVSNLQRWLDLNSIDFKKGQRKSTYVDLVRRHSISLFDDNNIGKKRGLSPHHKQYASPSNKKSKILHHRRSLNSISNKDTFNLYNAPLPHNLAMSPMSPLDDDDKKKKERKSSGGQLQTPSLNKTGIGRVDTPSKLQMRDEIRSLLQFDEDDDPLYPVKDNGITPGDAKNYDPTELNNVLCDLRREKKPKLVEPAEEKKKKVDTKPAAEKKKSGSFLQSVWNTFSPSKSSSNNKLSTTEKKRIHRISRTVPSPISSPDDSYTESPSLHDQPPPPSSQAPQSAYPMHDKYGPPFKTEEDLPQTPAISSNAPFSICNPRQSAVPLHKIQSKHNKQSVFDGPPRNAYKMPTPPTVETAVMPSIPRKMPNIPLPATTNVEQKSSSSFSRYIRFICVALVGILLAVCGHLFMKFDGMQKVEPMMDAAKQSLSKLLKPQRTLFCDTGSVHILSLEARREEYECMACPRHASQCENGKVQCDTNYIFQDNQCVLDEIRVKYAYNMRQQVTDILSERRGLYECQQLDTLMMTEDELYSKIVIVDQTKKMESFDYFKKNYVTNSKSIGKKHGQYFSYLSKKPYLCLISHSLQNNIPLVIMFVILSLVVTSFCIKCRNKRKREGMLSKMASDVVSMLDEYHQFNPDQHVPVDVIKQRLKPPSLDVWAEVEKLIFKDPRINGSVRMMDGMQKNCWKMIAVSSPNDVKEKTRFPTHSRRSMW